jgi:hypothetical protein
MAHYFIRENGTKDARGKAIISTTELLEAGKLAKHVAASASDSNIARKFLIIFSLLKFSNRYVKGGKYRHHPGYSRPTPRKISLLLVTHVRNQISSAEDITLKFSFRMLVLARACVVHGVATEPAV